MTIRSLRSVTVAAACLTMGMAVLNAQSLPQQNAKLAIRSGIVEVQRGNMWLMIVSGETLRGGEHIRTGAGSAAALEVAPGTVITLNELSQIKLGEPRTAAAVQLETGSIKVSSTSDVKVAAKETILESAGQPVDLELGFVSDQLNLRVYNGVVKNGPVMIHGGNQDAGTRTYTAGRLEQRQPMEVSNPTFYIYPNFSYGSSNANNGAIVPPVVNNPTNPGYRPTQIVPPMPDPIRVPVTRSGRDPR